MRALLAVLALALAGLAATALAADRPDGVDMPAAYGIAQRGSLKVVSVVRLEPKGGEMKGVWLDAKVGCREQRTLRVSLQIDLVNAAGKTTRVRRERSGLVDNCAEGGPNFGFDLAPRGYGLGCPDGRWKPGRYSMTTRTAHTRSGLVAHASLYHQVTRAC
ncbi:MAG TPA: hypothetical protein VLS46_03505 [Gaiellaceae bacterium]|nr:hypothetical protein [Gaiellaceae bacterium]